MPLSSDRFEAFQMELRLLAQSIVEDKRLVYTQGQDNVIRNFELISSLTGMTVGQVMAVYLAKQVIGAMGLLTDPNNKDTEGGTRFPDMLNYLELCDAVVKEKMQHDKS